MDKQNATIIKNGFGGMKIREQRTHKNIRETARQMYVNPKTPNGYKKK